MKPDCNRCSADLQSRRSSKTICCFRCVTSRCRLSSYYCWSWINFSFLKHSIRQHLHLPLTPECYNRWECFVRAPKRVANKGPCRVWWDHSSSKAVSAGSRERMTGLVNKEAFFLCFLFCKIIPVMISDVLRCFWHCLGQLGDIPCFQRGFSLLSSSVRTMSSPKRMHVQASADRKKEKSVSCPFSSCALCTCAVRQDVSNHGLVLWNIRAEFKVGKSWRLQRGTGTKSKEKYSRDLVLLYTNSSFFVHLNVEGVGFIENWQSRWCHLNCGVNRDSPVVEVSCVEHNYANFALYLTTSFGKGNPHCLEPSLRGTDQCLITRCDVMYHSIKSDLLIEPEHRSKFKIVQITNDWTVPTLLLKGRGVIGEIFVRCFCSLHSAHMMRASILYTAALFAPQRVNSGIFLSSDFTFNTSFPFPQTLDCPLISFETSSACFRELYHWSFLSFEVSIFVQWIGYFVSVFIAVKGT